MSGETHNRGSREPLLVSNASFLRKYAEDCFGATVEVVDRKAPSVSLLRDLDPLIVKLGGPINDLQPERAILAFVTERFSPVRAIGVWYGNDGEPDFDKVFMGYVGSIRSTQGTSAYAEFGGNVRLEGGALVVTSFENREYSDTEVFTNPRPNTQTASKALYSHKSRRRTERGKNLQKVRKTVQCGRFLIGAPSEDMAIRYKSLCDYDFWPPMEH